MFSAHLLFGDLNGHSALPFEERARVLEVFWRICEDMKPPTLKESRCSFFDIDNDSLMAGFSDLPDMQSGTDVLNWALKLNRQLNKQSIQASFGVDLLAVRRPLQWPVDRGFIDNARRLFTPDPLMDGNHPVQRSRIIGDALIVTARLQALAKATGHTIVFSLFQGGNVWFQPEELGQHLGGVEVVNLSEQYDVLGDKARDLVARNVKAYGIPITAQQRVPADGPRATRTGRG